MPSLLGDQAVASAERGLQALLRARAHPGCELSRVRADTEGGEGRIGGVAGLQAPGSGAPSGCPSCTASGRSGDRRSAAHRAPGAAAPAVGARGLGDGLPTKGTKDSPNLPQALAGFDRFLSEETSVGGGQWSLVTLDDVHGYLVGKGRFALQPAMAFFTWLRSRKCVGLPIACSLPKQPRLLRIRLLSVEQVAERYRRWTTADAHPPEALVGLLALVHCLRSGELRTLELSSVVGRDRLRVGSRIVHLAEPVAAALARYLAWRDERYAGPSTHLFVSRASRLHDRPVSRCWLHENVLDGISVASLRQTAIQHLIQGSGCDGLQVASYAGLSLDAGAADTPA